MSRVLRMRVGLARWGCEELQQGRYMRALSLFAAAFKGDLT